jgi:large subunit ribosomal protein L2
MPMKQYNPTSPGRRFVSTLDFSELTKKEPERKLTEPLAPLRRPQQQGPHHGLVPRRRPQAPLPRRRLPPRQANVPAKVAAFEYDPNRSARLALPALRRRRQALHPAPEGLKLGQTVLAGDSATSCRATRCRSS